VVAVSTAQVLSKFHLSQDRLDAPLVQFKVLRKIDATGLKGHRWRVAEVGLYPPESAPWVCRMRSRTVRAMAAGASSGMAKHELTLISQRTYVSLPAALRGP